MTKIQKEFYWEIGNRIRNLRIAQNCSIEKLAEKAGISSKYLYQIENGRVSFSTIILDRLCRALKVESTVILAEEKTDTGYAILCRLMDTFTPEEKAYITKRLPDLLK